MEFISPHLVLSKITKRLFNRDFDTDIQFYVDDKIVYAHSLALTRKSVVFEQILGEVIGIQKLIPIVDCKYESFLEFIRFMYTSDCEITTANGIEILKLATRYKVVLLENKVINCVDLNYSKEWILKLFEHCVVNKYDLIRNTINLQIVRSLDRYLESELFITLHPDAVDGLLSFDSIPKSVSESQLYTALGNWITSYCMANHIPLSEGRQQCDHLFKKIRFPTMLNNEINECSKIFPGLLSKIDCMSIAEQTIFGGSDAETNVWHTKCRAEFIWPYEYGTFHRDNQYETRLSVLKDTILYGIRIGANAMLYEKPIEMEISISGIQKFFLHLTGFMFWELTVNLGDSLHLKSNCDYKIIIKYLNIASSSMQLLRRKDGFNAIINDVDKSVRILQKQISRNVFELFFKSPTN